MSFVSPIFIFVFFPLAILGAYIIPGKARNIFILFVSAIFYIWGDFKGIISVLSIWVLDYLICKLISSDNAKPVLKKMFLLFGMLTNVSMLFAYKLFGFSKPLGISFIAFSTISFMLDVYRGKVESVRFLNLGFYILMFPKLIMGPIVRYNQIEEQLNNPSRHLDFSNLAPGLIRFIFGMSKKLILADFLAHVANRYFLLVELDRQVSVIGVWMGAIAYSLQLYFDFSGYSDMAIGLGGMLGFKFNENFNYPYCAKSVTDFWRRWHISLSSWFLEYVYIPLGGSRKGPARQIVNLFVVWILTGLWHGIKWTFVLWGMFYFVLLVIEKLINIDELIKDRTADRVGNAENKVMPKKRMFCIFYRILTLILVNLGWVIFRAPNLFVAVNYIKKMFGVGVNAMVDSQAVFILNNNIFYIACGIICSVPVLSFIKRKIKSNIGQNIFETVRMCAVLLLLFICISSVLTTVYNPFLYLDF